MTTLSDIRAKAGRRGGQATARSHKHPREFFARLGTTPCADGKRRGGRTRLELAERGWEEYEAGARRAGRKGGITSPARAARRVAGLGEKA